MSEVKVNKISPRTACGTTTLGDSGDTFNLPSGTTLTVSSGATITNNGTQTGFGREGSVNWQTSSIKTSTFTATSGEGYFVNSGSALTMNLPAGSAGAIVAVSDYARNFATYNLTVSPNGSEKIGGTAADATLNVNGQAATFVYVDSTKGWINVQNSEDTEAGSTPYLTATGGTITTSGDYKIHKFTGPGTFAVSSISSVSTARNTAALLVVAGGGAGGSVFGGGGGAGGLRERQTSSATPYTASPLVSACSGIVLTASSYPIVVGAGGTGTPGPGSKAVVPGNNSSGLSITSASGGGGGTPSTAAPNNPQPTTQGAGDDGGSGGGVSDMRTNTAFKGAGNVPPVSPPQGNPGGMGVDFPPSAGGGGGGATAAGTNAPSPGSSPSPGQAGPGGAGGTTEITASPVVYAGGGGGGIQPGYTAGTGGPGGGGAGKAGNGAGTAGTANLGGGGGGGGTPCGTGGNGGSGVVIIRYKYQ